MLMQTRIKLDKYSPNIRKKAIILHIASPAFHSTVEAQAISKGIIRNVTWNERRKTVFYKKKPSIVSIYLNENAQPKRRGKSFSTFQHFPFQM